MFKFVSELIGIVVCCFIKRRVLIRMAISQGEIKVNKKG